MLSPSLGCAHATPIPGVSPSLSLRCPQGVPCHQDVPGPSPCRSCTPVTGMSHVPRVSPSPRCPQGIPFPRLTVKCPLMCPQGVPVPPYSPGCPHPQSVPRVSPCHPLSLVSPSPRCPSPHSVPMPPLFPGVPFPGVFPRRPIPRMTLGCPHATPFPWCPQGVPIPNVSPSSE